MFHSNKNFRGYKSETSFNTPTISITLPKENWVCDDGLYIQAVAISGFSTDQLLVVGPSLESVQAYLKHFIYAGFDSYNNIEFVAKTLPVEDIDVEIALRLI